MYFMVQYARQFREKHLKCVLGETKTEMWLPARFMVGQRAGGKRMQGSNYEIKFFVSLLIPECRNLFVNWWYGKFVENYDSK